MLWKFLGTWNLGDLWLNPHFHTQTHSDYAIEASEDHNKVPNLWKNWKGLLHDIVVIKINNSNHQSDLIISSLTSSGFRNLLQLCARTSVLVFLKGYFYIVHVSGCTINQTLLNVCKMSNAAHCSSKMFNVDVKHFVRLWQCHLLSSVIAKNRAPKSHLAHDVLSTPEVQVILHPKIKKQLYNFILVCIAQQCTIYC